MTLDTIEKLENSKNLVAPLSSFDYLNSQDKANIQLTFTQSEIDEGNRNMEKLSINLKDTVVSIILREKDYLKKNYKG